MEVYEITGFQTGVSDAGVKYLQPVDSFQNIFNGFIYRQVLQSRQGFGYFCPRVSSNRIYGIFEHTLTQTNDTDLLVFDSNNLYKFNTGTGSFDLVPFGGSMAAYTGFNLTQPDSYISGTTYPDANNNPRFVFCGEGIAPNVAGSSIFFYDGTNVLDYTDVGDNPNYVAPAAGSLTSATYVLWFNERINFIVPIINSIDYQQGVLYSGIRTISGNGDNFNVAGSGLFQADTFFYITGATILGQIISLNFNRMAYTLEKTRDAFNPYFGRGVPGVYGTDAKFSAQSWADTVRSLGKTGILGQDGRKNLRVDNKIPYFTQRQINQINFNWTYGGFDRLNNQFLWSYLSADSDVVSPVTQDSVLVGNYEENSWSVFDMRFSVLGQTDVGLNLTWDDIDETTGNESWAEWDTTNEIWDRIGLGQAEQKTLAGDNLGFIYELNADYCDYFSNISAITRGSTTTLTVSACGILVGDQILVQNVDGLLNDQGDSGINNYVPGSNSLSFKAYNVLSSTGTSVEIDLDSSLLTAYVSGGSICKFISFYAETIPFNPYRSQGRRCYVSHLEFLIECNGGGIMADVYADDDQTPFIKNVICQPNLDTIVAGKSQWVNMTVDQEANFLTFVMKQNSPEAQLRLTSMRIHCEPGGFTSG